MYVVLFVRPLLKGTPYQHVSVEENQSTKDNPDVLYDDGERLLKS